MIRVYLLKNYQEYSVGEVIMISNNVAHTLIEKDIARVINNEDFIKKDGLGITKMFDRPPSRVQLRQKKLESKK